MDTPTEPTNNGSNNPEGPSNSGGQSGSATMIYEPGTGSLLNVGRGQSGGGTADTLPAAQDKVTVVEHVTPVSTTLLAGEFAPNGGVERSLVHIEAPELAAAALAANQQPAPTDPIEQIVSQLHTRVTALEDMAAQPSSTAEIASLRSAVDSVINWMETQAPLMDKVWHLFNVHWAGKVPDAPVTPETNKGV